MSGLLPRTTGATQSGTFSDLTAQTLVVSGTGFISNLSTAVFSAGQLETTDLSSPTSLTISTGGSPQMVIPAAGIVLDNTAGDFLALNPSNELVYCNDVVDLSSVQTLTNKTLTSPIISTISNTGTLTLPTTTTTLVGRNTTDTFTNKTIDSAGTGNTITITSGALSADNINNVLNQRLKTTNSPTFVTVNAQQLLLVNAINDSITVQSTTSQSNQILFTTTGPTNQTGFGYDNLNSYHRVWGYANSPMVFATNNTERLRIPAGGIANDNSLTNVLALNGTTLGYVNDLIDATSTQTLSNKSFSDGPSMFGGKKTEVTGTQTTTDGSTVTLVTISFPTSNTVGSLDMRVFGYATAGALAGTTCAQRLQIKVNNVAGTLSQGTINNSFSNSFTTGLGVVFSGTDALVQVTGTVANTIRWAAYATTYYE